MWCSKQDGRCTGAGFLAYELIDTRLEGTSIEGNDYLCTKHGLEEQERYRDHLYIRVRPIAAVDASYGTPR